MYLNFYRSVITSLLMVFLFSTLTLPNHLTGGNFNFIDFADRFESSDFCINSFYLWWTSFYYLPTAFATFVFSFASYRMVLSPQPYTLFFVTLVLFSWADILDYWALNLPSLALHTSSESFNVLLSNSVNKYHPLVFYSSVATVLTATLILSRTESRKRRRQSPSVTTLVVSGLLWLTFTLFLGSWWAYQEGSWGGWWNWDPSEVLGLITALYALRLLHTSPSLRSNLLAKSLASFYALLIVFAYVFIQLNFNLVSHNFGTRPDSSVGPAPMYIVTLLVLITCQCYGSSAKSSELRLSLLSASNSLSIGPLVNGALHTLAVLVASSFLLYFSFLPVFNDFLGRFLGSSLAAAASTNSLYTTSLVVSLALPFWSFSLRSVVASVLTIASPLYVMVFFLTPSPNLRTYLHLVMVVFLLVCTAGLFKSSTLWGVFTPPSTVTTLFGFVSDRAPTYVSLAYPFLETSEQSLFANVPNESVWGFERRGSSVTRYLSHQLSPDTCLQSLHTGASSRTFDVTTLDNQVVSAVLVFSILYVLLTRLALRTSVITF